MLIEALVSTVWTCPEPTVLLVFDGLDKVLAHFVCCGFGVSMLAQDDLSQLGLVPVIHVVLLLALLVFCLFLVSAVGIQTLLLGLALDSQVVTELALLALFAVALFEELTQHCLGIGSEWDLLNLYWLEELSGFFARRLGRRLFLLALCLLRCLALLIRRTSRCLRGFELRNLFLGGPSLFVLHTKGLVHDNLLRLGLVALALGCHVYLVCVGL